jgi:alkane 1-monooxygenase
MGFELTALGKVTNAFCHMAAYGLWPVFVLSVMSDTWSNWTAFCAGWFGVPLLDLIAGDDWFNLTKKEEKEWRDCIWFRVTTWFHTPFHIAGTTFAAWWISNHEDMETFEYVGLLLSCGTITGFGIGCVHEMCHRKQYFDHFLGFFSLIWSLYPHFWIEHVYGHHRNVSTDLDCASSDKWDIPWLFVPKCIVKTTFEAFAIEAKILRGKYNAPWYSPKNRCIRGLAASALVVFGMHEAFGKKAAISFVLIGLLTSYVCDSTNYIEHYGLRRRKEKDGEYETVNWFHSWDTPAVLTNTLLFKIQRHPDHHTNAGRPYQILRTYPFAPQLPTGYAGCIVMSWFPPLWFWVMHPRIEKANRQREEYERTGCVDGVKVEIPKGRRAVASFDEQADRIILNRAKDWVDDSGNMTPTQHVKAA